MRILSLGILLVLALGGCSSPIATAAEPTAGEGLKAFASEAELGRFARN